MLKQCNPLGKKRKTGAWPTVFALSLSCMIACLPLAGDAKARTEWLKIPYKYFVVDQDIREVLLAFGHNVKVPVKISSTLNPRRVRSASLPDGDQSAEEYLRVLCETYGLSWYFDGTTLNVSGEDEMGTDTIRVTNVPARDIERQLRNMGWISPRFQMAATSDNQFIAVSGSTAYRTQLRSIVTTLDTAVKPRPKIDVQVIRGGS